MPSRADVPRVALERALRAAAVAAVAFAFVRAWSSLRGGDAAPRHVDWAVVPSPAARDALAALRHAGTSVTWRVPALEPVAVSATRAPSPDGAVRLAVVGGGNVVLRDESGARDTIGDAAGGAELLLPAPAGAYDVDAGTSRGHVPIAPPVPPRPILVLGRASWETQFVTTALEEEGWVVESRMSIAPAVEVRTGAPGVLDPRRYAAVVALDSTLASYGGALREFVRAGGGLVLAGDAPDVAAARALAPATAGPRVAAGTLTFDASQPLRALTARALTSMHSDAVVLARRGAMITSAARRVGA
ncbi:MAG: hypothetical protein HY084_00675, partial [Gemmatimonadetes bacterium]|nr:hypothetical protein [Gemmatimonadota bacterium]